MFGKNKRIAELEADLQRTIQSRDDFMADINELKAYRTEALNSRNQVEYLVRTIRDMDQLIFNMSQCTDFNGMRPYFKDLSEGMIARKRAESDRIGDLIRPELIKTYGEQKRLK